MYVATEAFKAGINHGSVAEFAAGEEIHDDLLGQQLAAMGCPVELAATAASEPSEPRKPRTRKTAVS